MNLCHISLFQSICVVKHIISMYIHNVYIRLSRDQAETAHQPVT